MVAVLLRFCKAPRNDEIALQHFFFLSFLQQRNNFFRLHLIVLHAIFFSSDTRACRKELNGRPPREQR